MEGRLPSAAKHTYREYNSPRQVLSSFSPGVTQIFVDLHFVAVSLDCTNLIIMHCSSCSSLCAVEVMSFNLFRLILSSPSIAILCHFHQLASVHLYPSTHLPIYQSTHLPILIKVCLFSFYQHLLLALSIWAHSFSLCVLPSAVCSPLPSSSGVSSFRYLLLIPHLHYEQIPLSL